MKWTLGGGSSSVFKRALQAAVESMCASSRMKTRWAEGRAATIVTCTLMSLMFSTELWEAASNSWTSRELPTTMAWQVAHWSQGSPSGQGSSQLIALARMRAVEVLPVPRGPAKR